MPTVRFTTGKSVTRGSALHSLASAPVTIAGTVRLFINSHNTLSTVSRAPNCRVQTIERNTVRHYLICNTTTPDLRVTRYAFLLRGNPPTTDPGKSQHSQWTEHRSISPCRPPSLCTTRSIKRGERRRGKLTVYSPAVPLSKALHMCFITGGESCAESDKCCTAADAECHLYLVLTKQSMIRTAGWCSLSLSKSSFNAYGVTDWLYPTESLS